MVHTIIGALMSPTGEGVALGTELGAVLASMAAARHSCALVVHEGRPVGIITERDVVRLAASGSDLSGLVVEDVMSAPVICVRACDNARAAMVRARELRIRHLAVVDRRGRLIGIVSSSDLLRGAFNSLELQAEALEGAVQHRTQQLEALNHSLELLTLEDQLTGVGNRRAMDRALECLHAGALRYESSFSVVLVDIDFFKRFNDHYGHPEADTVLQRVVARLAAGCRRSDTVYRYGGEEFLLLLPNTDAEGAQILSERLVTSVEEEQIPHARSSHDVVTISAGVASFNVARDAARRQDVIERADQALYRAKGGGRNRSCVDLDRVEAPALAAVGT